MNLSNKLLKVLLNCKDVVGITRKNWKKLEDGSSIHYRYVKLTTGETLSKPIVSRKTLAKEKAVTQLHKRESIDEKNIITSKRQIKKPARFISF